MNDVDNKIALFIKKIGLFPEMYEFYSSELKDENDVVVDDLLYGEFYLIKKLSLLDKINIEKIKNSTSFEEYEKNVESEFEKIQGLNSDYSEWLWGRLYEKRKEVFSFIDNLDIKDFNVNLKSDLWFCDDYLNNFIDKNNIYNVLSIYSTFYDEKISESCDIDVIYDEFSYGNIIGHKARLDMINNHNYTFSIEKFPRILEKLYDLIIFNLDYSQRDSLDKSGLIKVIDGYGGKFDGDDILHNISSLAKSLTYDGVAIIKTPFTFVSKLTDEIIDKNIIDKIIYLPKENSTFAYEDSNVKYVYIVVNNHKNSDEIEFIDKVTGETCVVKNDIIKKYKGCTNMHIYDKHNPMLEKLYKIKESNCKQLEIINKESEFISKEIDELDFE